MIFFIIDFFYNFIDMRVLKRRKSEIRMIIIIVVTQIIKMLHIESLKSCPHAYNLKIYFQSKRKTYSHRIKAWIFREI